MLGAAVVLFIIAAIFGSIILTAILRNQPTPKSIVFTHGPIAAIGLILLLIYIYYGHKDSLLLISVSLFILAALGGLTLFTIDMSKKPIPKFLAITHPIIAVIALLILIIYMVH